MFDTVEDPLLIRNPVNENVLTEEHERLVALQEDYHGRIPVLPEPDYGFQEKRRLFSEKKHCLITYQGRWDIT